MDYNALKALTQIGKIWAKTEPGAAGEAAKAIDPNYVAADLRFSECPAPIIASNLAKGYDLETSVQYAKNYISGALNAMLDLGKGSGPMDHGFRIQGDYSASV